MEKNLEKNQKIHHFYNEENIKKEYKFWNTQLVPRFNQKLNNTTPKKISKKALEKIELVKNLINCHKIKKN